MSSYFLFWAFIDHWKFIILQPKMNIIKVNKQNIRQHKDLVVVGLHADLKSQMGLLFEIIERR